MGLIFPSSVVLMEALPAADNTVQAGQHISPAMATDDLLLTIGGSRIPVAQFFPPDWLPPLAIQLTPFPADGQGPSTKVFQPIEETVQGRERRQKKKESEVIEYVPAFDDHGVMFEDLSQPRDCGLHGNSLDFTSSGHGLNTTNSDTLAGTPSDAHSLSAAASEPRQDP